MALYRLPPLRMQIPYANLLYLSSPFIQKSLLPVVVVVVGGQYLEKKIRI